MNLLHGLNDGSETMYNKQGGWGVECGILLCDFHKVNYFVKKMPKMWNLMRNSPYDLLWNIQFW